MDPTKALFVSPLLTNVSIKYTNDNYLAEKIYPIVQVKKDTGKITTYAMDNLRVVEALRAIGSQTNEVGHSVSIGDHYVLQERALKELVPDEHMEQADTPIKPKIDSTENLMDRILVIKEKLLADSITSTSVVTQNTTLSGTDQWSDYANSDPIGDVRTGINTVRASTGKKPNTLILSWDTWQQVTDHPDVTDRVKYSQLADIDSLNSALARIFNVKRVWVGDAQYNSAAEGVTAVLADIWSKVAIVAYIEDSPTLKSRSFGFTYQMKAPRIVDTWRGSEGTDRKGDFVRVTDKYDQQIVDVLCAYLIYAAIA